MDRNGYTESSGRTECGLQDSPEWCALGNTDLEDVEKHARCRCYETGEVIFYEGDPVKGVYFVKAGLVGVRKADLNGNSTLLKLAWPGDTLGYRPLLAGQAHRAGAEALRQSVVCMIDARTARTMIEQNPALGLNFLKRAARELGDAEQKFHDSVTLHTRTRFAHLLVVLQDRFGRLADDGSMHLDLPVSRSDIAAMLGVRRESVSRVIHELEDTGVAHFVDRSVVVPDPGSLAVEFAR